MAIPMKSRLRNHAAASIAAASTMSDSARSCVDDDGLAVWAFRLWTTSSPMAPASGAATSPMSRSLSSARAMAASISSTVWGPSSTGRSVVSALITARVNRSENEGLSGSRAMGHGSAPDPGPTM